MRHRPPRPELQHDADAQSSDDDMAGSADHDAEGRQQTVPPAAAERIGQHDGHIHSGNDHDPEDEQEEHPEMRRLDHDRPLACDRTGLIGAVTEKDRQEPEPGSMLASREPRPYICRIRIDSTGGASGRSLRIRGKNEA